MLRLKKENIPNLAYFALGAVFAVMVIATILLPRLVNTSETTRHNYGKALAQMAAEQAVDASFNNDLVRMHVILQDVIKYPDTVMAAVYDVDNNLLVQAGATDIHLRSIETYSAPIVLTDSVAGYLSVLLTHDDNSKRSVAMFMALVAVTALAVCLWCLYYYKAIIWVSSPKTQSKPKEKNHFLSADTDQSSKVEPLPIVNDDESESASEHETKAGDSAPAINYAFAHIRIANISALTQQLNPNTLRVTLKKCETLFTEILGLYAGHNLGIEETGFTLSFPVSHNDSQEALFRACCSAHLILELNQQSQRVPLHLSASVYLDSPPSDRPPMLRNTIFVQCGIFEQTQLNSRINIQFCEESNTFLCVNSFRQPYQNLLANQLSQLQRLH